MVTGRGRVRTIPLAGCALLGAIVLARCGGAEEPEPSAEAREPGASAAAGGPQTPGVFTTFPGAGVPSAWPERERGLGVVHLIPGAGPVEDTLNAHERPDSTAPVLARLMLDTVHVYRFEARAGLLAAPGALEYGYEDVGFPILERGADGWERVYLGADSVGRAVSGWARARPPFSDVTLWQNLLADTPVFFVVPQDSIRFHAAPEGVEEPFVVEGDDYILWPLEWRGDWLRVRAAAPSDYCASLDAPAPRQDTLWIRWRTETGRPRVWFFTRGC
jgi:hypothetical protein